MLQVLLLFLGFLACQVTAFVPRRVMGGCGMFCSAVVRDSSSLTIMSAEKGPEFDYKDFKKGIESRMIKSLDSCQQQMATIRAGGANPQILDRLQVEYFGTFTPLNQLARVAAQGPEMLVVEPFDKSLLKEIEKVISASDLRLTPTNDGTGMIRISIPPLTEERRKELAKNAKTVGEESKVAIRNIRRDAMDRVKESERQKALSKDDSAGAQAELQIVTDGFIKKIDMLFATKEKDLLNIKSK